MSEPTRPPIGGHGAAELPAVVVDSHNLEIKDDDGFVGDRANKGAFSAIVADWRKRLRKTGEDPLGDIEKPSRPRLEQVLAKGSPEAAALVHSAVEDFAVDFAEVIRRFLRLKAWRDTERIVVGGGMRESRLGELAIGRAGVLLRGDGSKIELVPIRNHPDEAGLIGAIHLAPTWIFGNHDGILAADIGGTNIRTGIVALNAGKAPDLSKARVLDEELWAHREEAPSRAQAVRKLTEMLKTAARRARKDGINLAPFIGIGCPGIVAEDGSIERGAQNLPGNWQARDFNLPALLREAIPTIGEHETVVLMHNDAVVQGLSEVPFMQDVERWGVLTIGTGLGNARFTNRPPADGKGRKKPRAKAKQNA